MEAGVANPKEIKRHIQISSRAPPTTNNPDTDRRYNPSTEDIKRLVRRKTKEIDQGLDDQEFLQKKVEEWQKNEEDFFYYQPSTTGDPQNISLPVDQLREV